MRCKDCGVDLGEEYKTCPLCGAKASDEEAVLKNIKTVLYPKYEKVEKSVVKAPPRCETVCKYVSRSFVVLSALLILLSLFGLKALGEIAAPAVMIISSLFCFVCALVEKSTLLHCSVNLFSGFVFSLIFCLIAYLFKMNLTFYFAAIISCALLILVLAVIKPKKLKQQLCAIFRM
ncbi:MAG: hypothetical protein ACI4GY_01585 [Acutalibacteraceae bacterium]